MTGVVGCLLGAALVAGVARGQVPERPADGRGESRSPRCVVLAADDSPTDRALAAAIRSRLPEGRVEAVTFTAAPAGAPAIPAAARQAGTVVVAVGVRAWRAARDGLPGGALIACGRLGGEAARAAGDRGTHLLPLGPRDREVADAVQRFLGPGRRIGAVTGGETWPRDEDVPRGLALVLPATAGGDPAVLIDELEPRADVLLVPDEAALVPIGEALVREAQRRRLPVVTTAPWLARSGALLGVLPRIDLEALVVAAAVRRRLQDLPPLAPPLLPPRCELDLDALRALPAAIDAAHLALADRLSGGEKGR